MQVYFQGILLKASLRDETHLIRALLELQLLGSQRGRQVSLLRVCLSLLQGLSSGRQAASLGNLLHMRVARTQALNEERVFGELQWSIDGEEAPYPGFLGLQRTIIPFRQN